MNRPRVDRRVRLPMRVQCAPLSMLPIYSALPSDLQAKIFQSAPAVTASVLVRPSAEPHRTA
jgi:hypothetical protein